MSEEFKLKPEMKNIMCRLIEGIVVRTIDDTISQAEREMWANVFDNVVALNELFKLSRNLGCSLDPPEYKGLAGFCRAVKQTIEWGGVPLIKTKFVLKDLLAERKVIIQPYGTEQPWMKVTDLPDWLVKKLRKARRKIDVAREVCRLK